MSSKTTSPHRKRGGQPGNINALKHGFYARRLPFDKNAVSAENLPPADTLDEEIAMIRIAIRNLVAKSTEPQPLNTDLFLLRSLSFAVAALNRMIKTRYFLRDNSNLLHDLMHAALDQIRQEQPDNILNDFDIYK